MNTGPHRMPPTMKTADHATALGAASAAKQIPHASLPKAAKSGVVQSPAI